MKDDLYQARRIGQHRRFHRIVRPGMVLLTDRQDGSLRRELVREGFSAPSDGLLWFPDVRDRVTYSLLEDAAFDAVRISLPLEELVDRLLAKLEVLEPPAEAKPSAPRSPWTSASVEPPSGTQVLVMGDHGGHRWFCVARRETLRAFVGDEPTATGPFSPTWIDAVEGVRIGDHVRYWMPIPELPPEAEVRP